MIQMDDCEVDSPAAPSHPITRPAVTGAIAGFGAVLGTALTACGGGGDDIPPAAPSTDAQTVLLLARPTETEASRFLAQASMGASRAEIARVRALGYAGWLDEQMALPISGTRWDTLVANGLTDIAYRNKQTGFDPAAWRKLLSSPDTLRQRITLALSEIFVTSIDGLGSSSWKQFSSAAYLDMLEAGAFGNHRDLLQQISRCVTMGVYLTFRGSAKADLDSGALPDENYARELMQLFTIGLVQLHLDGTPILTDGQPSETYGQEDITGLARVFTGWDLDLDAHKTNTPDYHRRPMAQVASRHENGESKFLDTTIKAGTGALQGLTQALDTLFAHANVAPFFCRQLIQRLVTSNPSPDYVERVATVFNNDGSGVRGNLRAVVRALLLDAEARGGGTATTPAFGKLREPMLRFTGWARAFNTSSPSGQWNVGNTSDPAKGLAQSPLRSPSVFNFFRPGYVPPNSPIGNAALVAPEFQIANESSLIGVVNFMQRAVVAGGVADLTPDYSGLLAIADDAAALIAEINLVLAANQLSAATVASLTAAVQTMPGGTDALRRNRIHASLVLVIAAPEFIVQK